MVTADFYRNVNPSQGSLTSSPYVMVIRFRPIFGRLFYATSRYYRTPGALRLGTLAVCGSGLRGRSKLLRSLCQALYVRKDWRCSAYTLRFRIASQRFVATPFPLLPAPCVESGGDRQHDAGPNRLSSRVEP